MAKPSKSAVDAWIALNRAQRQVFEAIEAKRKGNELLYQRLSLVEAGLIIAGYGIDAANPE